MTKTRGKMRTTIKSLGTNLVLNEGDIVHLVPATNIPNGKTKWFASNIHWKHDGSILVNASDVTLRGRVPGR